MKIGAIIEARMASTRLPGKVLIPIEKKLVIEHLFDRLRHVSLLDDIIVATTTNKLDDQIEDVCRCNDVNFYRGSEEDVMSRVYEASKHFHVDIIVSITADCPLLDPEIVSQCISLFVNNICDYASNTDVRSFPDGMDVQVYYRTTLENSLRLTDDILDHEHVTLHIRKHPELFSIIHFVAPPSLTWPELAVTLDEIPDLQLIEILIKRLGTCNSIFGCREIIELIRSDMQLYELNSDVKRKGDT
ncbi:conserved hypothetical protein [Synechococcus sp. CC9902]|uniref:glycosyltransferase family protein n=1 Tax=Synechococcus sp. (strain CC9902) TaxID=316279 RepID=UPI00005D3CF6|nr:glycosyltransferase family protein [Synechococcus sp. CC9902]ABB25068.1 conserved hypothetical protein [Synechococcus sp. CC9902]